MKRFLFLLIIFLIPFFCFAQTEEKLADEELNPVTGFPEIKEKPFIMFNEGATFGQITRSVDQREYNRTDFVWRDFQIGLYCEMQTGNMKPFDSIVRVAVYYPFAHSFNGMEQISKQVLLYGFDVFAGVLFQTDMWKYVRLNFAVGPHFDYQLSDEYHHFELGAGGLIGCELPLAKRWTILLNGISSIDFGNLGTNRKVQPYSFVWQYQIELGVRYSKKGENKFSYIHSRPKQPKPPKQPKAPKNDTPDNEVLED